MNDFNIQSHVIQFKSKDFFRSILLNFTIEDTLKILPESSNTDIENILNEINTYPKTTGIMIGDLCITQNNFVYLFIFDYHLIIFNEKNFKQFQQYFKVNCDKTQFYFLNLRSKNKFQDSKENDNITQIQIDQTSFIQQLYSHIIYCIIKKSQIRTKIRYENSSFEQITFDPDDFISIFNFNQSTSLCFNIKDQFLYVLKQYTNNNSKHEISFYTNFNNKSPFISKCYGIIEKNEHNEPITIVLEYIDGEKLEEFFNRDHKKIDKMRIILELMLSLEFLHINDIIYRDLKFDNILIDTKGNAILIDFDQAKKIDGSIMTGNIGKNEFVSPEQFSTNDYSLKTDIYSLGKIIHFIITRKLLKTQFYINENSNNEIEIPPEFIDFYEIYKSCFELSPDLRPSISNLLDNSLNYEINSDTSKECLSLIKEIYSYREKTLNSLLLNGYKIENIDISSFIGIKYLINDLLSQDSEKAIKYLTLSANQNNSNSQFLLGKFYYKGKYVSMNINKAINYLTLSANQNNSNSQFLLGKFYYKGKYVSMNVNKAINYLTLSANQNNSKAQFLLGFIYCEGDLVFRDINKSIYYLTLSTNQNNSTAQLLLGFIYYKGKYISPDIHKALYYLTLSSNQNNSMAQYYLGEIYYLGEYISQDINKSIYYFTLSANQNDSDSQYYLGEIYYFEKYSLRDINKSIYYLNLSVAQNNSKAQYLLGLIYYEGQFILRDINKSIYYLNLSAKQKNSSAQFLLGKIYYEGQYITEDINKSFYYLTLSANQNNSDAQCYLGQIYFDKKDINKSLFYLTMSAKNNNSLAQKLLGGLYYFNKYIPRDIEKAIYYFTLSANKGESDAQNCLGFIYFYGQYDFQDIKKAIYYFTLSSDQYNPLASYHLGLIYYEGKYVERDINKAIHFFKNASSFNHGFSKNNLGIIYKNGDGVKKNIYNAIEYFNEAIKYTNDLFSLCNLGRIYYFGIDIKRNIKKAIYLLKKLSKEDFYLADIFLLFIYFHGENSTINIQKGSFYLNKKDILIFYNLILYYTSYQMNIVGQRMHDFFKEYDLVYSSNIDIKNDFLYFMCNGKLKTESTTNKTNLKQTKKDIDENFYKGFNDD